MTMTIRLVSTIIFIGLSETNTIGYQNTPLQLIALPTDTVEVTDPTHPWYGLTFPLLGITTKPRLGRVCIVQLYRGVERVLPLAATSLGGTPPAPCACRLSVEGLQVLLAVVATLDSHFQEEAPVDSSCSSDSPQPPARLTMARVEPRPSPPASRSPIHCPSAALGDSVRHASGAGASNHPTHSPGGTA